MPARMAFHAQKPLAQKYQLWLVDRRGYGSSPTVRRREDWQVDGEDLLAIIPDGAHLVGVSYGTLGCVVAAAAEPQRLASLTLVECPAFSLADGDPAARRTRDTMDALIADRTLDDAAFFTHFVDAIGAGDGYDSPLPSPFDATVPLIRSHRAPWDGDLPLDAIASAQLPTLVVTSGEHQGFDAVADHLAAVLGARREYVPGAGHLVPLMAQQFNDLLDDFFRSVPQGVWH